MTLDLIFLGVDVNREKNLNSFRKYESFSSFAVLFLILCSGIYYFIDSFHLFMPHGYDEVITVWPLGRALHQSSLGDYPRILFARFLAEDHLFPVNTLFAYLLYSKKLNPMFSISIATKLSYVLILISTGVLASRILFNRNKIIIVLLLVVMNQSLMWSHLAFNLTFNIVLFLSVVSLFFLNEYLVTQKNIYLTCLFFSLLFGVLTFENFFASVGFLAIYSTLIVLTLKQNVFNKLLSLSKLGLVFALSLLPYIVFHFHLFGTMLPKSRLPIIEGSQILNFVQVERRLLNDWFFGAPDFLLDNLGMYYLLAFAVSPILLIVLHRLKLIVNLKVVVFAVSLFFSVPIAMYTGRYHPGLWTFFGIILIFIFSDFISNLLDFFFQKGITKNLAICGIVILLILANNKIKPFYAMKKSYQEVAESSIAAYKALNTVSDHVVVVRLPGAEELFHPIAFWIGNKIYNNEPGLSYDIQKNAMVLKGMDIQNFDNRENKDFYFFEHFTYENSSEKKAVLFKSKNLFFRYGKSNLEKEVFRGFVIPGSVQDAFTVYLPKLPNENIGNTFTVELTLNGPFQKEDYIFFNKTILHNVVFNHDKASFKVFAPLLVNEVSLVLFGSSGTRSLESIRVTR